MAIFRLLHASDLHLSRAPFQVGIPDSLEAVLRAIRMGRWPGGRIRAVSSHHPDIAREFARCAYSLRDFIDAIVLTGDLATTGDGRDLRRAHTFIDAPAANGHLAADGEATLKGAGKDVVILPGNHDRFEALFPYAAGNLEFDDVFQTYWRAKQGVQRAWEGAREGEWLVLIAADFTLDDGDNGSIPVIGHLGQGRAYASRVETLRAATLQARVDHPGCTVLWLMHFHPLVYGVLELLDAGNLAMAVQGLSVGAILCGHTHQFQKAAAIGGCPIFVAGTATQFHAPQGNDIQLVEVETSRAATQPSRVSVTRLYYDPARGFVAKP